MDEKEKIAELLSAYIDGELPSEQARAVEELLQRQPELAKELESLQKVKQLIRDLPRASAPDDLAQKVLARVERKPRVRLVSIKRFGQLAAAAGIILLIGIGIIITQLTHKPTRTGGYESPSASDEKTLRRATPAPSNLLTSAGASFVPGKAVMNIFINTDNLALTQKQVESILASNNIKLADSAKATVAVRKVNKLDRESQPINIFKRTQVKPNQIRYEVVITQKQLKHIINELNAIRASQNVPQVPLFTPKESGGGKGLEKIALAETDRGETKKLGKKRETAVLRQPAPTGAEKIEIARAPTSKADKTWKEKGEITKSASTKRQIRALEKLHSLSKRPTVAAATSKESKSRHSFIAYTSKKAKPSTHKATTTQPHLAQIVVILTAVNTGR